MKFTYNDLEYMVNESVRKILREAKSFIDNFDMAARLLDVQDPDDFHYVQIVKRYKDNTSDDKQNGNYHAGAWYLGGYRVHNADELMALKQEIIDKCDQNNARAYITVNKRSDKETDNFIKIYRKKYNPKDPRYIHADEIIPSQAKDGPNWVGQRKRLIVDIDVPQDARTKDGDLIWDEVREMIKMTGIIPLGEYVTPSGGLHIILPDKEDKRFIYLKQLFKKFDDWQDKGRLATVHPNIDARIILYSNVDTAGY